MNTGKLFRKRTQIKKVQRLSVCMQAGIGVISLLVLVACAGGAATSLQGDVSPTPESVAQTAAPEPGITPAASDTATSEAVANQCKALADAFNQKIWDTSGWVHGVNDRNYFNNVNGAYDPTKVEEFWYRFSSDGYILEGYNWSGTQGEEIQPEGIWLNGWYDGVYVNAGYNLEYDFDSKGEIQGPHSVTNTPYDFSAGFCADLAKAETASVEEMIFRSQAAWKFSYEIVHTDAITIRSIYFSQEDGTLLRYTTYKVKPDGSGQLILEVDYHTFEFNADPPEERFAEIWARVPHGEGFVPVEEGTP